MSHLTLAANQPDNIWYVLMNIALVGTLVLSLCYLAQVINRIFGVMVPPQCLTVISRRGEFVRTLPPGRHWRRFGEQISGSLSTTCQQAVASCSVMTADECKLSVTFVVAYWLKADGAAQAISNAPPDINPYIATVASNCLLAELHLVPDAVLPTSLSGISTKVSGMLDVCLANFGCSLAGFQVSAPDLQMLTSAD